MVLNIYPACVPNKRWHYDVFHRTKRTTTTSTRTGAPFVRSPIDVAAAAFAMTIRRSEKRNKNIHNKQKAYLASKILRVRLEWGQMERSSACRTIIVVAVVYLLYTLVINKDESGSGETETMSVSTHTEICQYQYQVQFINSELSLNEMICCCFSICRTMNDSSVILRCLERCKVYSSGSTRNRWPAALDWLDGVRIRWAERWKGKLKGPKAIYWKCRNGYDRPAVHNRRLAMPNFRRICARWRCSCRKRLKYEDR